MYKCRDLKSENELTYYLIAHFHGENERQSLQISDDFRWMLCLQLSQQD